MVIANFASGSIVGMLCFTPAHGTIPSTTFRHPHHAPQSQSRSMLHPKSATFPRQQEFPWLDVTMVLRMSSIDWMSPTPRRPPTEVRCDGLPTDMTLLLFEAPAKNLGE